MGIANDQLTTWAKQGAVTTSAETYATIKGVLAEAGSPYADKSFKSFLQGSYGNDTNVLGVESDVDIVLRCDSIFYYDLSPLSDAEKASFKKAHPNSAPYTYADFKTHVTTWLQSNFKGHVEPGDKAIRITASYSRREADVLPCVHYKRYLKFNGLHDETHVDGVCFFTPDGTQIINYPELHSANMTTRHKAANQWLKPTVRVIKNMRNAMVAADLLEKGLAPSYYIEGLFYNVPFDCFGTSYEQTFTKSVNWLLMADRSKFLCANEQYYLLSEKSPVTWRTEKCTTFLNALADYWNNW